MIATGAWGGPAAGRIDTFVESAVALAFHGPGRDPADPSGAALFPDRLMDLRQRRWDAVAALFDLPACPGGMYGQRVAWAGAAARRLADAPAFQRHLHPAAERRSGLEHPLWLAAWLAFLVARQLEVGTIAG